jgi:putative MATE family efflux protein
MLATFFVSTALSKPAIKLTLLAIAWPIFIEQALRMSIGTVDTFMVSHVSDGAVAGLSVAHQIVFLFLIAFNFIGIGTSVVLTHFLGANDRVGADQITTNAIATNTWLGLVASIGVYFCAAPMLRLMHLPEDLMQYAVPFLSLMGGTLFMESMNMSIAAVLRAHGHTRDAMFVALGQNILNVAGNAILLFGLFGAPKMGVLGVALSSVFSRCCACVAFWILLDRRTHLRLKARDFVTISWVKVKRILHIGLPAAGENMCYWLALMVVTTFTARLGASSLAIQSYTLQIQSLVMLFSLSIGIATEILIGHLVGAGLFEEAYRTLLKSLRTGFMASTGAVLFVAILAPFIFGIFTQDVAIIAGGTLLLRVAILLEPGRVFNIVVINSLRATGDVGFPIKMAVMSMWLVWVPLAWLLSLKLGLGLAGIWLAMATDEWLRGVLMYRRWKSRRWIKYAERSRAHVAAGFAPA